MFLHSNATNWKISLSRENEKFKASRLILDLEDITVSIPLNSRQFACSLAELTLYINRLLFRTHQLILIGRDGGENGLREDKRLVLLLLQVGDVQAAVVGVSTADQVYPRLIPVHRVEHDLQQRDPPLDYSFRDSEIKREKVILLPLMNSVRI